MDTNLPPPSAFDEDIEVPTTRPELPATARQRWNECKKTLQYRLTEVPPWAHRPVALTVLCAVIAAMGVVGAQSLMQRWERQRSLGAIVAIDAAPGLLVGIAAGLASTGDLPAPTPVPAGVINVHVAGEVKSHGMVTLPAGSRAVDAIKAAGGATELADLDQVNLARVVIDGDQVLVPVFATPESVPQPTGLSPVDPPEPGEPALSDAPRADSQQPADDRPAPSEEPSASEEPNRSEPLSTPIPPVPPSDEP